MELTHRQRKQLSKILIQKDEKHLMKWIDDVHNGIIIESEQKSKQLINDYLDLYGITVAYTLHYVCGFGKKRLTEVMSRIWNNIDCFKEGYLSIDDCVNELKEYGITFTEIVNSENKIKWKEQ